MLSISLALCVLFMVEELIRHCLEHSYILSFFIIIIQAISQNQDEFLRFLNDPSGTGSGEEAGTGVGGGRVPQGLPGIPGMPQGPPGTVSIPVTQEEKEAIDRVSSFIFLDYQHQCITC